MKKMIATALTVLTLSAVMIGNANAYFKYFGHGSKFHVNHGGYHYNHNSKHNH